LNSNHEPGSTQPFDLRCVSGLLDYLRFGEELTIRLALSRVEGLNQLS
jgi:hypothetical protein